MTTIMEQKTTENSGQQIENSGKPINNNGKQIDNNGKPLENSRKQVENKRKPDGQQHKTDGQQMDNRLTTREITRTIDTLLTHTDTFKISVRNIFGKVWHL